MKDEQLQMSVIEFKEERIRIFTDGAGARSDGKGSRYAFFRPDTGEKQVISEDGLTNNQAEYKGILLALESLPNGTIVEIHSDSEVICSQLKRLYAVREPKLVGLFKSVQEIIQRKNLKATFVWISRQQNLAGKLLE